MMTGQCLLIQTGKILEDNTGHKHWLAANTGEIRVAMTGETRLVAETGEALTGCGCVGCSHSEVGSEETVVRHSETWTQTIDLV